LHLIYNALAAPTEKAYATVNDSPEAIAFSWEVTTTPVDVPNYKPTAVMTIDSTVVGSAGLIALEEALYGTAGSDPRLPTPAEVIAFFSGAVTEVEPTQPTFVSGTNTITIPVVTGVVYLIDGVVQVPGPVVITEDTLVTAQPAAAYSFPDVVDDDWMYNYT